MNGIARKPFSDSARMPAPAVALAVLLSFAVLAPIAEAAEPATWSIETFNSKRDDWETLVGIPLKVEGRYSSLGKDLLRFTNCPLSFVLSPDVPPPAAKSRRVEVTGRLTKQEGKLVFRVERLRELPSELVELRTRARQFRNAAPSDWYELGDWGAGRAKFYEDAELARAAREIYTQGILLERDRLPRDEVEGLLALADKAKQFGLTESLRSELAYEGLQRRWDALRRNDGSPEELEALAAAIAERLPESRTPLNPPQPRLHEKYRTSPLGVYRDSGSDDRQKLHRIFYTDVALRIILQQAREDGRNGFDVAQKIDEQVPEQRALAESYRDRAMTFRLARIGTAGRQDALNLAEQFRQRNQPEKARETLRNWIKSREPLLRQDGTAGLIRLADDYLSLLEDDRTAAALLIEAYELDPQLEETATRLSRLGYQLRDGKWLNPRQAANEPEDPVRQAMREGRVIVGMSDEEVRKSLGRPTSIARAATAAHVSEIWIYGEPGSSRLAVEFSRLPRDRRALVQSIDQVDPFSAP